MQDNQQITNNSKKRGWHGDPEGHRNAGRRGGEARKKQIANDPSLSYSSLGKKGGKVRKEQIDKDPSMSYKKLGKLGGKARSKNSH